MHSVQCALYMYLANTESRLWRTPRPSYESHQADGYISDEGQSVPKVLKVDDPGGSSDKQQQSHGRGIRRIASAFIFAPYLKNRTDIEHWTLGRECFSSLNTKGGLMKVPFPCCVIA